MIWYTIECVRKVICDTCQDLTTMMTRHGWNHNLAMEMSASQVQTPFITPTPLPAYRKVWDHLYHVNLHATVPFPLLTSTKITLNLWSQVEIWCFGNSVKWPLGQITWTPTNTLSLTCRVHTSFSGGPDHNWFFSLDRKRGTDRNRFFSLDRKRGPPNL